MAEKKDIMGDSEDMIVVMADEDGTEYYYREEMILPVNGQNYALLVSVEDENEEEHDHGCDCGCGCENEEAFIARVVTNEDGEDEYIMDLTDEEFEAVQAAYDRLVDEDD